MKKSLRAVNCQGTNTCVETPNLCPAARRDDAITSDSDAGLAQRQSTCFVNRLAASEDSGARARNNDGARVAGTPASPHPSARTGGFPVPLYAYRAKAILERAARKSA